MLKKLLLISLAAFVLILPLKSLAAPTAEEIIIYVSEGCSHCANVEKFLRDNPDTQKLNITVKELRSNPENADEFIANCSTGDPNSLGVPQLYFGQKSSCIMGDTPIIAFLKEKLAKLSPETKPENKPESVSGLHLTIPLLVGAALVDAINPCEFAVLIVLVSAVLALGIKKRALLAGLAFSLAIFISYFLMGLGLYRAVAGAGFTYWFTRTLGLLAIVLGLFNLKDFFWYGKGFIMEVPRSWRPKMLGLLRRVTSPVGAFVTGFVVSLFLLPCTSGPYIVVTSMLGQRETFGRAFSLLILYNLIFIIPMIIITLAIYFGLPPEKLEEIRQKKLRILHLIAGLILIAMGAFILWEDLYAGVCSLISFCTTLLK